MRFEELGQHPVQISWWHKKIKVPCAPIIGPNRIRQPLFSNRPWLMDVGPSTDVVLCPGWSYFGEDW